MASHITERSGTYTEAGGDLVRAAETSPMVSLLVMGAVVIGGSMLIAAMMQDRSPGASGGARGLMGFASPSTGLGRKGTETLSRIRDAVFSFVFDKAVSTADEMFPGFREHYERG